MLYVKGGSASFKKNVDVTPTGIYRSLLLTLVAASHFSNNHQTATEVYCTELWLTEHEMVVRYMPPW